MASATRPLVVHVVDDDDDVRGAFVRLLRSAGLEARAHTSVRDFIDAFDPTSHSCILLDVTMPGFSGAEALAMLQTKGHAPPVIVISARDDEPTQTLIHALGAKMFLRKPVDDQALLDAISWATQMRVER